MSPKKSSKKGEGGASLPLSFQGPGAQLAQARERKGLTLAEISKRSRIGVPYLEAIEREDWLALPGQMYVRGFIRLYARELDLNVTLLLEALEAQTKEREATRVKATQRAQGATHEGEGAGGAKIAVIALFVLALSLISWISWQYYAADTPVENEEATPTP